MVSKEIKICASLHRDSSLTPNGKLEVVSYYNQTKTGVNALDQKVRHYSAHRKTNRWCMVVFYIIVDIVLYNAYVLYQIQPAQAGKKNFRRERFKFLLKIELEKPLMLQRAEDPIALQQKTKLFCSALMLI